MDNATPPLLVVGAGRDGLRLRALKPLRPDAPLRAWCRGIEAGQLVLAGPVEPDAVLTLPIARLPCVPLPAMLRIAAAPEGPDLADPWPVASPAEATALLGPSHPRIEDLRLEYGMLRGTGIERVNGLLQPALHAVINGSTARAVQAEPPVPLAEGGCAFRFALALEPADLNGSGIEVALHVTGSRTVLARFALGPSLPGTDRMAELESRMLRLEQALDGVQQSVQAGLDRRLAMQQERIDAFIDAAATLLLDRLAGEEAPATALRRLVAAATPEPVEDAPVAAVAAGEAVLAPRDPAFDLGWNGAEEDAEGPFRWMTLQGLLRNPAPLRPVAAVELAVGHLYGAPAPVLEASFDGTPCLVEVERRGPHHFTLRIAPPGGPMPCRLLRLQSRAGGSPLEDGVSGDERLLSIAVTRAAFRYAEAAAPR
ncbi:MAG: hypothetical protein AVDCRST_MAG27-1929 [uncultured Craurococcus sp.]|uniref:Uncharacterized protein n=1 Tax=uncultured Craurococcus sp. TaxID=1135998 RepID=A0A6J4IFV8_9PROT|nr:MAG: hypothetical protein AVDCRST_MAG27-1929 [uncultured Craurococcus sp.]